MKRSLATVTVLSLLMGVSIPACTPETAKLIIDSQNKIASISGEVLDSVTNKPIVEAIVTVGNKTVKTDLNGVYKIEELIPGAHKVVVSKDGYDRLSNNIDIFSVRVDDFKLDPIPGFVPSATPVPPVPPSASNQPSPVASGSTAPSAGPTVAPSTTTPSVATPVPAVSPATTPSALPPPSLPASVLGSKLLYTKYNELGLFIMNPDGSAQTKIFGGVLNEKYDKALWSPDGTRMAFLDSENVSSGLPPTDISVINADGSGRIKLTNNRATANNGSPNWSPDGQQIVFSSNAQNAQYDIYIRNISGIGSEVRLTNGSNDALTAPPKLAYPPYPSSSQIMTMTQTQRNEVATVLRQDLSNGLLTNLKAPAGSVIQGMYDKLNAENRKDSLGSSLAQELSSIGSTIQADTAARVAFSILLLEGKGVDSPKNTRNETFVEALNWLDSNNFVSSTDAPKLLSSVINDAFTGQALTTAGRNLQLAKDNPAEYVRTITQSDAQTAVKQTTTTTTVTPTLNTSPAWSPDGKKIAYLSLPAGQTQYVIYTINPDGSGRTQLTTSKISSLPTWSPDGKKLAFVDGTNTLSALFIINADGTGRTQVSSNFNAISDAAWSPNSTLIAFVQTSPGSALVSGQNYNYVYSKIYVTNADGSKQIKLTPDVYSDNVNTPSDTKPVWSPDGTRIAFKRYSNAIYVMNADGSNPTSLLSNPLGIALHGWKK